MEGFWIVLGLAVIFGIPGMAIAGFVKSRSNEAHLKLTDLRVQHLSRQLVLLSDEITALRATRGAAPAASAPVEEAQSKQAGAEMTGEGYVFAPPPPEQAAPPEDYIFATPPPAAPPPPKPKPSHDMKGLEEALTSRWLVWLGALTIALAGTFLVKYAIDEGLLGPAARVTLGFVLGVVLAAGGEWLRQRPLQRAIAAVRPNYVPPALTSSGLFIAFGSIYAAYALYGLIPPFVAFAGLALVALAAVGLSLLQGPFVALLGLFSAFATPALIATNTPSAWGLFSYLLLVEAACLALARYRAWWWFSIPTLAGTVVWPVLWIQFGSWALGDEIPIGLYLFLTSLAFFGMRYGRARADGPEDWLAEIIRIEIPEIVVLAASAILAALSVFLVDKADHSTAVLVAFGGLSCLFLFMGRREAVFDTVPMAAGVASLVIVGIMPLPATVVSAPALPGAPFIAPALFPFVATSVAFGALFGIAGFVALWGAKRPAMWAALSAATPVLMLIIAYGRIADFNIDGRWSLLALALGALMLFAAERVERYRNAKGLDVSLSFYATSVVSLLALAATMSLREAWLTVALSMQLPLLAAVYLRVPVISLRILASAIATAVLVRLVANYNIFDYPLGGYPALSWVLYGYGIPAVAFFAAAHLFRRGKDDLLVTLLQAGCLLFAVLLVSLEIRLFITARIDFPYYLLLEQSLQAISWMAVGTALAAHYARTGHSVSYWSARILLGMSAVQVAFFHAFLSLPTATHDFVGAYPIVNLLLLAYLVPAAFAFRFAYDVRNTSPRGAAAASIAGFILIFIYITLEVKRAFESPILSDAVSQDELYAISIAWLVYSLTLLGLGIFTRMTLLRYVSLAVLLLTVVKVFLLDMSGLAGLYRVGSFLGLGLSLVGIGYLYQRFVFRPTPRPA